MAKTHNIEIEGLPDGWKPVAYRIPKIGEKYFDSLTGMILPSLGHEYHRLIVEKIQPRRIVLEETEEVREIRPGEWGEISPGDLVHNSKINTHSYPGKHKIWRVVEEGE